MSFLTKSLEKRIKELHASIEAQKTELAAYEQVLALETGKPVEGVAEAPAAVVPIMTNHVPASSPASTVAVEFNGSRSDFVTAAVRERGAAGIAPAEISAAFAARKVAVSKNLVYNVLSLLFKQKKVRKAGGRYFYVADKVTSPAAAPAAARKKRRISPEGMKRIIAATKKRWALQKAAKKAAPKAK